MFSMEAITDFAAEIGVIFVSYLIGCLCVGYYLVRLFKGKDIREMGSGNVGARNVGRVLGPVGFYATLAGDAAKGAIAAGSASYLGFAPWTIMLSILAVIAGHIWPIQLGFRGGKGFATVIGALLIYDFVLAVILALLAVVIMIVVRRTTIGGLAAVALSPAVAVIGDHPWTAVFGLGVIASLIIFAHRSNIRAVLDGGGKQVGK